MKVPVLIEPVKDNGFLARMGEPFGWCAEGATADEALQRLCEKIAQGIATGSKVTTVEVPSEENPLLQWAGTWKDNPLLEDWQKAVADYRREVDNDPDRL